MGEVEMATLTKARNTRRMTKWIKNNPKSHEEKSKKGGEARMRLRPKINMEATWKAKGIEPWMPGEREKLFELLNDPAFQHTNPNYQGKPNYTLIADNLNRHFYGSNLVRTRNRLIGGQVR